MTATGFARRRDANEPGIIRALEAVGASVQRLNEKGVPDLLIGWRADKLLLLEVKTARGTHTGDQKKWNAAWKGPYPYIVRTPEEALAMLGYRIHQPGIWHYCAAPRPDCDGRSETCALKDTHEVGTYPRSDR